MNYIFTRLLRRFLFVVLVIIVFGFVECTANEKEAKLEIYLSTLGNDSNKGTIKSPLMSLRGAMSLISQKQLKNNFKEITVWLKSGVYEHSELLVIDSSIFQGKQVKLTIRSFGDDMARISGGVRIPSEQFKKVIDSQNLARLNPEAKGEVFSVNLKNSKVSSAFNYLDVEADWSPMSEQFSYLAWNEHLMQLACWPNRGYAHIDSILDAGPSNRWLKPGEQPEPFTLENPTGGKFTIIEETDFNLWEQEFRAEGQVILEGYLHNDWYFQRERIGRINGDEIQLLHHCRYGIRHKSIMIDRRIRFVNLLCELDQPGEWFFDHKTKELFVWPISEISEDLNLRVLSGKAMVKVSGLDNFTLRDVIFENGGELAVEINGGENNLIAGCTFRNFMNKAVIINGGENNGVTACTFKGLMSVGNIQGGNRQTLEPCNNFFTNNEIYELRNRGYGGIGLSGVGIYFAHNLLHDMNGALKFSGNDIVMEYNEFYNMGWEMGDWNVAYIGADWASFGNKFRFNFIHHLMETPGGYPIEGVRNDDGGMGVHFDCNIFYKSGRGAVAGSGSGNSVRNNIAIETDHLWQAHFAGTTAEQVKHKWNEMQRYDNGELRRGDKDDKLWRAEQIYGKRGWNYEPYRSKYPIIKTIMDNSNPFAPTYTIVKNNYISRVDTTNAIYVHKSSTDNFPSEVDWEYPNPITKNAFVDLSVLDMNFKPGFIPIKGFETIPFDKIGLVKDEYRTTVPDKNSYRKEIKERYKGIPSHGGKYNTKDAYKRYPVPEYLK